LITEFGILSDIAGLTVVYICARNYRQVRPLRFSH